MIQNAEPTIVPDAQTDPHFYPVLDASIDFVTRSILAVPLQSKGRVIGVIEALNKISTPFQPEDMRLLESLAASAAVAIENAQLHEAVQRKLAND